jgi:hypothetical protein
MLLIALLLAGSVLSHYAEASDNNRVMKACLDEYGYTPDNFNAFNFGPAAECFHKWRTAENSNETIKLREFLLEHPWYKGSNWQWEARAEYTCTKHYDKHGIRLCYKPIYMN